MRESYRKDLASHPDPESCADGREAAGEALTGAHADQPSSCEITQSGVPTPLSEAEGNTGSGVKRKPHPGPTQSETRCTRGNSLHRNWEVPRVPALDGEAGRLGKAHGRTPSVHARGKSDEPIVCAGQRPGQEG